MQVKEINNWESIEYYDEKHNRIWFEDGQRLTVKFPNGKTREVILDSKKHYVTYSDHGHTYPSKKNYYGFNIKINGASSWISITDVEII